MLPPPSLILNQTDTVLTPLDGSPLSISYKNFNPLTPMLWQAALAFMLETASKPHYPNTVEKAGPQL